MQKVHHLVWWPSLHDRSITPVWSHVGHQLPHSNKPPASPLFQAGPLFTHSLTHVSQFFHCEDDISILEASYVRHSY